MKIWMFVYNNCKTDARVLKEAKTLAEAGHDVRIVAVWGEGLERVEERDGFRILRVDIPLLEKRAAPEKSPAAGRKRLDYLWRRPFGFIYNWDKNELSGLFRTLLSAIYRPLSFFCYLRRAWRIVKEQPAAIYHCHDLNTLPLGYWARRRHGGKLVYDAHELTTELAYISGLEKVGWWALERFLIRRADEVITTGSYRAQYLAKRYGVALPTVIMNCPLQPTARPDSRALREKLGLTDNTVPIILYQGVFVGGRGLQNLILAVPLLQKGVLVLTGWGVLEPELKKLVRKNGLERSVYFTEPVDPDQVVNHCMSASVGVVIYQRTSLNNYYATPNKLYEYIHAGLPVVSSDFPALKEVVEEYGIGSTFNPEEPKSIAAAINLVLADKKRYDTMKKNALEATRIFNWENESQKLLDIYRRLN